ncbi:hypothetical protein AB6A40_000601 [Gnathostoma spinigerum]|uniref:NR LBD domain-containing protein n=1 Tax=Gnathostoma spinigerum TaxID=75299 RepID=A0ABD6EB31_9BILA
MSRDSAKFGRFQKKQREKQLRALSAGEGVVSSSATGNCENYSPPASPTVSSSVREGIQPSYTIEYRVKQDYTSESAATPINYSVKTEPIYDTAQTVATPSQESTFVVVSPPQQILSPDEVFAVRLRAEYESVHATSLWFKNNSQPLSEDAEQKLRQLDKVGVWTMFATELSKIIECICKFAKFFDEFNHLDEKIRVLLLKENAMELALVSTALFYDSKQLTVSIGGQIFPIQLFVTNEQSEFELIRSIHSSLHNLSQFQLTTTEAALYSAWILLQNAQNTDSLMERVKTCIHRQFCYKMADPTTAMQHLFATLQVLRSTAVIHRQLLSKFLDANPGVKLHQLYMEVFKSDDVLASS